MEGEEERRRGGEKGRGGEEERREDYTELGRYHTYSRTYPRVGRVGREGKVERAGRKHSSTMRSRNNAQHAGWVDG